ncbi:adenosylcobinamide-GDP ribazoletransferase [Loktanella sp. DJP18]|uniref:adenosylcobinamide-GDP ribazoletransferase n=1 Tax=Loktanella sp. DJP18 TaxID=3409788 RepID=UPI003BB6F598
MAKDDALAVPSDIAAALGLLTRLPVRVDTGRAIARGARAAWAWPIAGVVVNALAAAAAGLALWTGLSASVAALVLVAVQITVTGAMHEDGLADSLDGLWGGWDRARRLAIMKDSQIGTYGVLALLLTILLRWTLWTALLAVTLWPVALTAGALSRLPMVALAWALPHARDNGLSRAVGRPAATTLTLAGSIAFVIGVITLGWSTLPLVLAVALVTGIWGLIVKTRIGGQTGDILGASQQIAEVVILLTLTLLI